MKNYPVGKEFGRSYLALQKHQEKNASENVVCWSCLLQIIALHYWRIKHRSKQPVEAVWSGSTLFVIEAS